MKKIFCLLLALTLTLSVFTCAFAEEAVSGKVEITFKVGDSTLSINGKDVAVETPYVVGEGTTLVPLRVITEAFGATVGWEEATQKITLEYPDVNIVLQIGNKTVTVNDHTETLLAAPELPKDTTMVPLRFISETFGATVTYDEETELITVTKEISDESETPLKGITSKEKIGDSYYKWSMNTPLELFMDDRNFNGSLTYFSGDDDVRMYVNIIPTTEEDDFEADFDYYKNGTYGTLTIADKKTDANGNNYMHLRSKTPTTFTETYRYYTDEYIYAVILSVAIDSEVINDMYAIAESFALNFDEETTHDLSNVKDGYRTYENEDYKFSFDLPASWEEDSYGYGGSGTDFSFIDSQNTEDDDYISITFFSSSDTVSAKKLADKDHDVKADYTSDILKLSDVKEIKINDSLNGYYYVFEIEGSEKLDNHFTDVFFEVGDYTYNMCFSFKEENKEFVEKVLSSLKVDALDSETVGTILRNDPTSETLKINNKTFTMSMPTVWEELNASDGFYVYMNGINYSTLSVIVVPANGASYEDVKAYVDSAIDDVKTADLSTKIIKEPYDIKIDGETYRSFKATTINEEFGTSYSECFAILKNNKLIFFATDCFDIANNENTRNELLEIIKSFEIK